MSCAADGCQQISEVCIEVSAIREATLRLEIRTGLDVFAFDPEGLRESR